MAKQSEIWGSSNFGGDFLKKIQAQPAGLLVVLWGWAQMLNYFRFFLVRFVSLSYVTCKSLEYLTNGITLLVLLYTLYYLYVHRNWFKKPLVKTLSTVWIAMLLSMVFINLIQHNILHHIVFELQHALFMLLTALAILVTGSLIRHRWMFFGGIAFGLLAFAASYLTLKNQMLLEAFGWLIGFVIPGHMLIRRKE